MVDELQVQVDSFRVICKALEPALLSKWRKEVAEWKKDRQGPCPYEAPLIGKSIIRVSFDRSRIFAEGLSEAEVRRRLDREELDELKAGRAGVEGTSQTAFLVAGMRLESMQYVTLYTSPRQPR